MSEIRTRWAATGAPNEPEEVRGEVRRAGRRIDSLYAGELVQDALTETWLGTEARHIGTAHTKRAKVPCGMVFPLEMGEVIVGIAVLGAFGAEVSAGRGGLD